MSLKTIFFYIDLILNLDISRIERDQISGGVIFFLLCEKFKIEKIYTSRKIGTLSVLDRSGLRWIYAGEVFFSSHALFLFFLEMVWHFRCTLLFLYIFSFCGDAFSIPFAYFISLYFQQYY